MRDCRLQLLENLEELIILCLNHTFNFTPNHLQKSNFSSPPMSSSMNGLVSTSNKSAEVDPILLRTNRYPSCLPGQYHIEPSWCSFIPFAAALVEALKFLQSSRQWSASSVAEDGFETTMPRVPFELPLKVRLFIFISVNTWSLQILFIYWRGCLRCDYPFDDHLSVDGCTARPCGSMVNGYLCKAAGIVRHSQTAESIWLQLGEDVREKMAIKLFEAGGAGNDAAALLIVLLTV